MAQRFRVTLDVQVESGNDEDGQPLKVGEQEVKRYLQNWADSNHQHHNRIKVCDVEEYTS